MAAAPTKSRPPPGPASKCGGRFFDRR